MATVEMRWGKSITNSREVALVSVIMRTCGGERGGKARGEGGGERGVRKDDQMVTDNQTMMIKSLSPQSSPEWPSLSPPSRRVSTCHCSSPGGCSRGPGTGVRERG